MTMSHLDRVRVGCSQIQNWRQTRSRFSSARVFVQDVCAAPENTARYAHVQAGRAPDRARTTALFRKLHKAWRCRRRTARIRGLSLHEQPPQASTDLLKRYVETEDFPWAVGRGSFRQTVHGCMCGVRCGLGLPIYKGWRFESDCRLTIRAMNGHECTRDHPHHVTSLNYRSVSATPCCDAANVLRVGELEDYPPYLGSLLMAATSVRPS